MKTFLCFHPIFRFRFQFSLMFPHVSRSGDGPEKCISKGQQQHSNSKVCAQIVFLSLMFLWFGGLVSLQHLVESGNTLINSRYAFLRSTCSIFVLNCNSLDCNIKSLVNTSMQMFVVF